MYKKMTKNFSFNREAINHFKIYFSTLSERKIYFLSQLFFLEKS
ncbi:hypothetical protein HMPREF0794_1787 [Staphylococcus epidermidis M23864:W2(grey)]|nr:hypothetical protein HMPREF0794_1787 [Staphylococcus epidermidis M23864:W2(grey)]